MVIFITPTVAVEQHWSFIVKCLTSSFYVSHDCSSALPCHWRTICCPRWVLHRLRNQHYCTHQWMWGLSGDCTMRWTLCLLCKENTNSNKTYTCVVLLSYHLVDDTRTALIRQHASDAVQVDQHIPALKVMCSQLFWVLLFA